jgi:hypothetical protein
MLSLWKIAKHMSAEGIQIRFNQFRGKKKEKKRRRNSEIQQLYVEDNF